MRPHITMLSGDYMTFEMKSLQSGGSPFCILCTDRSEPESLEHLISKCDGLTDIRHRITDSMSSICKNAGLDIDLKSLSNSQLTQWILDPTSMNLKQRLNINHPITTTLFQVSRDFCFSIDRNRTYKLSKQSDKNN